MANQFFYPQALRSYLAQFMRALSGFQIMYGNNTLQTVPVQMGDGSRQVGQIIANASENNLPTAPMMSVYIAGLEYDRSSVQNPTFVGTANVKMRNIDPTTGQYGNSFGGGFSVDRYMPVPYKLTLKVDIWTTNLDQKLQIFEQILPLFNPALEIQSNTNMIDWSTLTYVLLTNTVWSSRSVPKGTETQIDIATMTFEMPVWLSLPAVVKKMGVIERIVSNIYATSGDLTTELLTKPAQDIVDTLVLTPLDFGVYYANGMLKLVKYAVESNQLVSYSWTDLVKVYNANIVNGISQIQLDLPNGNIVVGTIATNPLDTSTLIYTPSSGTTPNDTITPPITAIIDPYTVPLSYIQTPSVGTSYMILEPIGSNNNTNGNYAVIWGNLLANANDIITYTSSGWEVSFNSALATSIQFVTNLATNTQYEYQPQLKTWSKSLEGYYDASNWTITLSP